MSDIQFYCDEDSQNRALIKALRSHGAEVTSAVEAGLLGKSDEAQLLWAAQNDRVLRDGKSHAGIVVAAET